MKPNRNNIMTILCGSIGLSALLLPSEVSAEGSFEVGANQGLQNTTTMYVDIIAPNEEIYFEGNGTLTLFLDQIQVAVLSNGQSHTAADVGIYSAVLSEDQANAWTIDVSGASQDYGRIWSYEWNFNTGSFAESYATNA
ncbi:MAG: hypothetical protein VXZ96_19980, partial [Myxococcota bacterium]|nr:hypothetical protein [Myxococcota bacterium]